MKYCKSKRGYFYKVVGDKKTRISMEEYKAGCKKHAMKGGKLVSDGHLGTSNFDFDSGYRNINFNSENVSLKRSTEDPISVMYSKNKIPYVFFGYNRKIGKFRYVMYYDGKTFVFKEFGDFVGEIKSPNISSINPDILLNLRNKFEKNFYNTTANEEIQRIYDYLNHINIELKDNSQ
jgi:hypothetical protein